MQQRKRKNTRIKNKLLYKFDFETKMTTMACLFITCSPFSNGVEWYSLLCMYNICIFNFSYTYFSILWTYVDLLPYLDSIFITIITHSLWSWLYWYIYIYTYIYIYIYIYIYTYISWSYTSFQTDKWSLAALALDAFAAAYSNLYLSACFYPWEYYNVFIIGCLTIV